MFSKNVTNFVYTNAYFWWYQPSDARQLVFDDWERFFVAVFRRLLTAVDFLEVVLIEDPLASGSDSAEESDPASESESTSARFFRGGATCMIRQILKLVDPPIQK